MRIVIGEDGTLFREGLARLLEDAGHEVVAKTVDAPSLIAAVDTTLADLAIVDIRMPPDNTDDCTRAARILRANHPELGIVLLSQHMETNHSVELVSSGRFSYLLKHHVFDVGRLPRRPPPASRTAGSALDPADHLRCCSAHSTPSTLAPLTPREQRSHAHGRGPPQPGIAVGSGSPNARSKRTSPASSPSSASAQTKKTTDASSQSSPSSTTAAPRSPEGPSSPAGAASPDAEVGRFRSSRRFWSWAKRFGPSCCAHDASISPTASRITRIAEVPRAVRAIRFERRSSESGPALEVAEPFELAEQIVERLFADSQPSGQLGRPRPLRSRVPEDLEVRRVEVVEAALVQPLEHSALHGFPRHPQERADQRRPEGLGFSLLFVKRLDEFVVDMYCQVTLPSMDEEARGCRRARVKRSRSGSSRSASWSRATQSAGSVPVFEFDVPAGSRVAAAHSHDDYEETIYGLEGVLTWTVEGTPIDVDPGEALCIPRGAVHQL